MIMITSIANLSKKLQDKIRLADVTNTDVINYFYAGGNMRLNIPTITDLDDVQTIKPGAIVYSNPGSHEINIWNLGKAQITLINERGQPIAEKEAVAETAFYNLADGLYLVKVVEASYQKTYTVIVQ